jgi:hypothetical protein
MNDSHELGKLIAKLCQSTEILEKAAGDAMTCDNMLVMVSAISACQVSRQRLTNWCRDRMAMKEQETRTE